MVNRTLLLVMSVAILLGGCAVLRPGPIGNPSPPQPAKPVDLQSYLGLWYEIGRYEAPFQRDCEAVTATYGVLPDGKISVVNTCRKGAVDGPLQTVEGKAKVVPGGDGAKLKVSFFGPFYFGDYWVLDHADDYSWSIVGEGSGRYLWLLSRTAQPSDDVRRAILARAEALGYDLSLVRPTRQPSAESAY